MIVEVRNKNQITIPSEIAKSMSVNVGDQFEIIINKGRIIMIPVVSYPKAYIEEIDKELQDFKEKMASGEAKGYKNLDELLKVLKDY